MKRLLVVALVVGAASAPRSSLVSGDRAPVHTRTRFSQLTSDVWRYRQPFVRRELSPVPNNNPLPEPQPRRELPERVALDATGRKLYVTLPGDHERPGRALAVVDVVTGAVRGRIPVGPKPYALVPHPGGRYLVVTNELANYATVVDTYTDTVAGEIPLDFYCQGLVFSADGRRAWVANRYLDQVLVLDVHAGTSHFSARVREVGGFDDAAFYGDDAPSPQLAADLAARGYSAAEIAKAAAGSGGIDGLLRARCGRCHAESAGGFVAGPDPVENFLSAVENAVGGRPFESPLVRAVVPKSLGGFGDERTTTEFHPGGALFAPDDPDLARIVEWVRAGEGGPGIPVGNAGSHPKDLALSPDGRHLFVGNTGTMDVSIVDTEANREVGALYLQSLANHLAVVGDHLVVLTLGAGFGATKARDPFGAETWDPSHPAAQRTVLRDPVTTDPFPWDEQATMGPFDAVDGTWNFKMRDIQNDVVAIDLRRLRIPAATPGREPAYLLDASRYESHPEWVRYTSDTAEATTGDVKGDLPPELQRVHGAFPEWAAVVGDRLFVTMAGTFEVVEWVLRPDARDPADRMEPVRAIDTGLRPVGVVAGTPGTPSEGMLFVANQMAETVSLIDAASGARRDVVVGDLARPALDTDAEKGAFVVRTAVFSSDGDTSCSHCHVRDTGDGRGWGAGESIGQDRDGHQTPGGTLGIPSVRNLFAIQPFYFEGTHRLSEGQGADINEPASSVDFDRPVWAGDFTDWKATEVRPPQHEELKERVLVTKLGAVGHDLDARRDAFIRQQSLRWFGAAHDLTDLYRFVGAFMGNSTRLPPNPYDQEHPAVVRGRHLFDDARVACGVCHTAPEFTNKSELLAPNDRRALPPLTTITRRDASYTLAGVRAVERANERDDLDLDPTDGGRVEDREGSFTTMQLRGLWDRPPVFLHHGRARSIREVLATPGHPSLRRFRLPVRLGPEDARPGGRESGFNELTTRTPDGPLDLEDQVVDSHGGTSHLTPRQIEDLSSFLLSIE